MQKNRLKQFVFYSVFESDKVIPTDLYDKLYNNVIENLMQYSVIKEVDSLHCMIVNKVAHIKYGGNVTEDLEKKIKRESSIGLLLNHEDLQ